jgi:molybdopterin-guanine dinucleotide biosynthesis protein A
VLAGGRSSRFGSDKLRAMHRGVPLVHHAILRLVEICDDVVVVMAPGADASGLPDGARAAHDLAFGEGPLAGVQAGLLAAGPSDLADLALVVGGDMPGLQKAVLRAMLDAAEDPSTDAIALRAGDAVRPLPVVLRTRPAAAAVGELLRSGRRSLRDLVLQLRTQVIDEPTWAALDPERSTLRDIDEPADLDE